MKKLFRLSSLGILLASPTVPAAMQAAAVAQSQPAAEAAVAPLPAAVWTRQSAQALLAYIEGIGAEGLTPAAYAPDRLRAAIAARSDAQIASAATDSFLRLAADLSGGATPAAPASNGS
jgi:hypothetical protein